MDFYDNGRLGLLEWECMVEVERGIMKFACYEPLMPEVTICTYRYKTFAGQGYISSKKVFVKSFNAFVSSLLLKVLWNFCCTLILVNSSIVSPFVKRRLLNVPFPELSSFTTASRHFVARVSISSIPVNCQNASRLWKTMIKILPHSWIRPIDISASGT